MKSKIFLLALTLLVAQLHSAYAQVQTVHITVSDEKDEALPGANILIVAENRGIATDINGKATLEKVSPGDSLQISFTGYQSQTILFKGQRELTIKLAEGIALDAVEVRGGAKFFDTETPRQSEFIGAEELKHAACCNLSESFETNASVDVSQSDAATGAKQLRFLGLAGKYTQLQIDNIPNLRGLAGTYGLSYVPGTWIHGIDINKGAGSVTSGHESITGQINVRLLPPDDTDKLFVNTYANSLGRYEMNLHSGFKLNDKWSTSWLAHVDYLDKENDGNDDGFLDVPKSKQVNLLHRWKYEGDKMTGNWSAQFMADRKIGGQTGFSSGDDNKTSRLYGIGVNTNKFDFAGKNGFNSIGGGTDNLAVFYNLSYIDIDSYYGRRNYTGEQLTATLSGLYVTQISSDRHKLNFGFNLNYDRYRENLDRLDAQRPSFDMQRDETVLGGFAELTEKFSDRFLAIISGRFDHNSFYGNQFSPRLQLKYDLSDKSLFRLSAGKGVRSPNPIAENTRWLVSSREIVFDHKLKQEVAWNYGASFQKEFRIFGRSATWVTDYYFTDFENRLTVDLDSNPDEIHFQNLDGTAYAHSFQTEISFEPLPRLSVSSAYKYYDVRTDINGRLRQAPMISKHRYFLSLGYETRNEKWRFDLTGNFFGKKRLPDGGNQSEENFSPSYFTSHGQVSYKITDKLEVYIGGENLGDYTQNNPIIGAEDPFGDKFDAGQNWGPIVGARAYGGLRWTVF